MFNSNGFIPIGPKVVPLVVFTFRDFLIILTLSEIFLNNCCDIHDHIAPVSNRDVTGSILTSFNCKI